MSSLAKRMRPDKSTTKNAARRALRAARRADGRFQAVDEDDEVDKLEEQLNDLDYESDLDTTEEYDIIKNRCRRIQVQYNGLAAVDANKELSFACAVCFDNCNITCLRIITPCGHGFCYECTDKLVAAAELLGAPNPAQACCPTCRGPIASVIKAYF